MLFYLLFWMFLLVFTRKTYVPSICITFVFSLLEATLHVGCCCYCCYCCCCCCRYHCCYPYCYGDFYYSSYFCCRFCCCGFANVVLLLLLLSASDYTIYLQWNSLSLSFSTPRCISSGCQSESLQATAGHSMGMITRVATDVKTLKRTGIPWNWYFQLIEKQYEINKFESNEHVINE